MWKFISWSGKELYLYKEIDMKDNGMHLVEMELSLIMTDHSILEDGICLEKHKGKIFIEINQIKYIYNNKIYKINFIFYFFLLKIILFFN